MYAFLLEEIRAGSMPKVSIDEGKTSLDNQLAMPLPGRQKKVSDAVVEDEMALFKAAAAGR